LWQFAVIGEFLAIASAELDMPISTADAICIEWTVRGFRCEPVLV
jgi:hypothetical protein